MGNLFSGKQPQPETKTSLVCPPSEPLAPTQHQPSPLMETEQKEQEVKEVKQTESESNTQEEEFSDDELSESEGGEKVEGEGIIPAPPTKEATERLLEELKELRTSEAEKNGFSVEPVDDNIAKWHVKLFGWEETSQIYQDMFLYQAETERDHVLMEIVFPSQYPHNPPFLRVVYPRFHQYTGHITIGGSVCVKELTRSGWSTEFRLLTFLVMIRNLLLEGGALVDMDNLTDYSEAEGREAFTRVAQQHGWEP